MLAFVTRVNTVNIDGLVGSLNAVLGHSEADTSHKVLVLLQKVLKYLLPLLSFFLYGTRVSKLKMADLCA